MKFHVRRLNHSSIKKFERNDVNQIVKIESIIKYTYFNGANLQGYALHPCQAMSFICDHKKLDFKLQKK